jgi:hypothetical protein
MARSNLESRVKTLEGKIAQLENELRLSETRLTKDWRRTIGAFTDDEGLLELLNEAMELRDQDRKRANHKRSPRRKATR